MKQFEYGKILKKIRYLIWVTAASLILFEIVLRVTGIYQTYFEKIGKGYSSYYNQRSTKRFMSYPPNDSFWMDHKEFRYRYFTNRMGVRERNIENPKPAGTFRLIMMGDSFTEGMGAPYDSSWVRQFEQRLISSNCHNIEVFNFGISGADPFEAFTLFNDSLVKYSPDLAVYCMNKSDLDDYIFKGGFERYQPDGTMKYRSGPWFETFYRYSHVARYIVISIFGKSQNLVDPNEKKTSITPITKCFLKWQQECRKKGISFFVIQHPEEEDINNPANDYTNAVFSMLADTLSALNLHYHDIYKSVKKVSANKNDYYWPTDGHFNSKGYTIMGNAIYETLAQDSVFKKLLIKNCH